MSIAAMNKSNALHAAKAYIGIPSHRNIDQNTAKADNMATILRRSRQKEEASLSRKVDRFCETLHEKGVKAVVVNPNSITWGGNITAAVAKAYAMRAVRRGHLSNAAIRAYGIFNASRAPVEQKTERINLIYDALLRSGAGSRPLMEKYSLSALARDRIRGPWEVLSSLPGKGIPVFVATFEGDVVGSVLAQGLGASGYVSNVDVFQNGKLSGFHADMTTGRQKADGVERMLRAYGEETFGYPIKLSECAVIGGRKSDIALTSEARLGIASHTSVEVEMVHDIVLSSDGELHEPGWIPSEYKRLS